MKLLFDENLSPQLVALLSDAYPDSAHVHFCGLGSADDAQVWDYAEKNGYTIVSKDSDFQERSVLLGPPPKVIWILAANCSSSAIERLLRQARPTIEHFALSSEECCLLLGLSQTR